MNRQNWNSNCEDALNNQIKVEYQASYHYHLLASYFYRTDIGLLKLGDFFNARSLEEREHADKMMKYQCTRGGVIKLHTLPVPELVNEHQTVLDAFNLSLVLEKSVNEKLLALHATASENNDPNFCSFLDEFLEEQVKDIQELANYIARLKLIDDNGLGIIHFVEQLN